MVEFFKTVDGRITEVSEFTEGCWVNMVHPSSDELEHSHRQIRQRKVFLSQWLSRVMKMSFFQTLLMSLRLLQKLLPQEIFNMSHMAC